MSTHDHPDAPARVSQALPAGRLWRRGGISLLVQPRTLLVCLLLLLAVGLCAMLSLLSGRMQLGMLEVMHILLGHGSDSSAVAGRVVWQVRMPRTITALSAGAALGVSGAIFQSISRNVLGSPDLIGFTMGAASGALLQIIVFDNQGPLMVSLAAIGGGMVTAAIVYLLSLQNRSVGGYRLVLVGIGTGAILAAFNNLLLVRGQLDNAISANLWLAGSLNARTWSHALPLAVGTLVLVPLALLLVRPLQMIEMGDDMARQLGIQVERTRLLMTIIAVTLAALATGATGPIAFIALAAPQLARRLNRNSRIPIISAALMGALLLLLADQITHHLPIDMAIPIGRMTGIIGGIYLAWLLLRYR